MEIEHGADGPFVAAVDFEFDSLGDVKAVMPCEEISAIMADGAHYTTIRLVMQIAEGDCPITVVFTATPIRAESTRMARFSKSTLNNSAQ